MGMVDVQGARLKVHTLCSDADEKREVLLLIFNILLFFSRIIGKKADKVWNVMLLSSCASNIFFYPVSHSLRNMGIHPATSSKDKGIETAN